MKIGKTKIKMPNSWHEVPYSKAVQILDGDLNEIQVLALLTDKTEQEIRESTDIETIFYLLNSYTFLKSIPDLTNTFPRSVKIGPDTLMLPYVLLSDKFDLGEVSSGQVEDMQNVIMKMSKEFIGSEDRTMTEMELIKIMPHLVAIYLKKQLGEVYGERLVRRVKEMAFDDILSMGYFFFKRLTALMNGRAQELQNRSRLTRRLKLGWHSLMQRLASMPRLTL